MDLDNCIFFKIQGVLMREEQILGSLNTIKKEKTEEIAKIVGALRHALKGEDFNQNLKSKLYILLFLNTDTVIYGDLKKTRKYAHLVGFLPKISKDVFTKIVFSLQLEECVYESVKNFPTPLAYEVLDICLNALGWLDLFETVNFVEKLLASLFSQIVKIGDKDNFDSLLKEMFQRLLLHYDAEKGGSIKRMGGWKSSQLKHYAGLVLASLLSLLEKCTNIYCKKEDDNLVDSEVYKLQIDKESLTIKRKLAESARMYISVQQCYEHVLAKCYENICAVTIDLWLFWVEIDMDDIPDTENTLQRLVGEKAFTCREILKEAECSGVSSKEACDLISKLLNIALKPHVEEDDAHLLDLPKILTNIEDPNKTKIKWIRFLLNNALFTVDPSALEVLGRHLTCLQTADVIKLSSYLFDFVKTNKSCKSQKDFIFEMFKILDLDMQVEVCKSFVDICGISEILKTEDFQPNFVEVFNKVNYYEDDKEKEFYSRFLRLALQSAKSVVSTAVREGITSEVRGHLMAEILGKLQPFCEFSDGEHPLLATALDKLLVSLPGIPENHRANYCLFVRELVMRKNLNGEKFINGCLMTNLHLNLTTENWAVVKTCLETLTELFDINCDHHSPASIVMMLQVVQGYRWRPSTFDPEAVRICELALSLIDVTISKWYEVGMEDKQMNNLCRLVRERISPLNRCHLYRLLTDEPLPSKSDSALQLIYRMHYGIGGWSVLQLTEEEKLQLVYSLCYVLPVLTSNEWQEMFCVVAPKCTEFIVLFHIVTDSLILCLDSAKVGADYNTLSCLNYAISNVVTVLEHEVGRWTKDDNEYRISALSKLCQLVSAFPLDWQQLFEMTMIRVLQKLLPSSSRRKPLSEDETNRVTVSIATIKSPAVRQSLANCFLKMFDK